MKKLFVALFAFVSVGCFAQDGKEVFAVPESNQGFYIFCLSKPAGNYEFLGAEKIKLVALSSAECEARIIKRAKEYPGANGLILKGANYCEVEVIKLKE